MYTFVWSRMNRRIQELVRNKHLETSNSGSNREKYAIAALRSCDCRVSKLPCVAARPLSQPQEPSCKFPRGDTTRLPRE
ncbi:hypothetical protein E2C01_085839 [Portunus trituberculatus]|uniref:Uncharacterized protein n=1 Tax=Portunus trituberculatus TaxID=210409 RepID=A0A5B7J9Y8_PORTR|nr:hypothetical protein [Portunus trituberculatus]